jgi:hypothetical protein
LVFEVNGPKYGVSNVGRSKGGEKAISYTIRQ